MKFFVIATVTVKGLRGVKEKIKSKEFSAENAEVAKKEAHHQFPSAKITEIILYQLLGPGETVEWVGEEFILSWNWYLKSGWEGPFFVPGNASEYKWARRPKWRKFLAFPTEEVVG